MPSVRERFGTWLLENGYGFDQGYEERDYGNSTEKPKLTSSPGLLELSGRPVGTQGNRCYPNYGCL